MRRNLLCVSLLLSFVLLFSGYAIGAAKPQSDAASVDAAIAQAQGIMADLQAARPNVTQEDPKKANKLDDQIRKLSDRLSRAQILRDAGNLKGAGKAAQDVLKDLKRAQKRFAAN